MNAVSLSWRDRLVLRYFRAREHPGRLRLIGWLRRVLGVGALRVELAPGAIMELDEREYVQRQILLHGGYETATLRLFTRLLAETTHVCDVGAHVGQYTLLAARALTGRGRVYAFEPTPANAARLLRNAELSGLDNIELFTCAIGERDSIAPMSAPDAASTGSAHLMEHASHESRRAGTCVPVATFSTLAPHLPREGIDLLKIDVEGHDARVLTSLFASTVPRPRHLIVEFNPRLFDYGVAGGLPALLERHGYDLRKVDGSPWTDGADLPNDNLWAVRRDEALSRAA